MTFVAFRGLTMKYRFLRFELIPATRLLSHDGLPVVVPRRAFDCLLHLIEHRDRAIGRDELARVVWGRDNVSDNQIAQAIATIRRLFGERGSDGPLLRTVPAFGYHWIGAVDVDAGTDPDPALPSDADTGGAPVSGHGNDAGATAVPRRRLPWLAVAAVVAVLIATGMIADHRLGTAGMSATVNQDLSSNPAWVLPAVLPEEPDLAWARVALMALIGERLRSHGLPVVPVENVFAHLGSDPDAAEDSLREAGAQRIVRSSANRDGRFWRVALTTPNDDRTETVVYGHDEDLLKAAESAADTLVSRLGGNVIGHGAASPEQRLASIRHTVRAGDIDSARTLLARLPPDLRDSIQVGLIEVQIDAEQGRIDQANERLAGLLERVQVNGDDGDRSEVLLARMSMLRLEQRQDWYDDVDTALELAERSGSLPLIANALNRRGIRHVATGAYDAALQDFTRVRRIRLDTGDELGAADALANLGRTSPLLGNVSESLDRLSRSAKVYQRYGAMLSEFLVLQSATAIQIAALRWHEALASSDRAHLLLPHITDPGKHATFHRRRAAALAGLGRLREAEALMDEADRIQLDAKADVAMIARENRLRSTLLLEQGRLDEALAIADAAFVAFDDWHAQARYPEHKAQQGPDISLAVWMQARAAIMAARPGTHIALSERHLAAIERGASPYALIARGDLQRELGQPQAAESSYREALAEAERSNSLSRIFAATDALVQFLIPQRRVDEAGALVDALYARDPETLDRDYSTALLMLRLHQARGDTDAWIAAMSHADQLAGERAVPTDLLEAPVRPQ